VLEIGTGSGYGAAVLSVLAAEVCTIERLEELAESARTRLVELGYANVHVRHGDGSLGWPAHAPYDAIVVTASGPDVPTYSSNWRSEVERQPSHRAHRVLATRRQRGRPGQERGRACRQNL